MNRWLVLPLLVAAGMYAVVGNSVVLAGGLSVLLLVTTALGGRVRATPAGQVLLGLVLVTLCAVMINTVLRSPSYRAPGVMRTGWVAIGACTLLLAGVRMLFEKPIGGDRATLGIGLVALTACGGTDTGWLYPAAVVLFIATAMVARHFGDSARPPLRSLGRRHLLAGVGGIALTAVIALAPVAALPPLHDMAMRTFLRWGRPHTGFSERMYLGSMRGMLQDDEVVMRIYGPPVDHLRGVVFRRYVAGQWRSVDESSVAPVTLPRDLAGAGSGTRIEAAEREPDRLFVPLAAARIASPTGVALADRNGILAPLPSDPTNTISVQAGQGPPLPVSPPGAVDLQIPRRQAVQLRRLALDMIGSAAGPERQLEALELALQTNYTYSLEVEVPRRHDPVLHFLTHGREGHCEYFAASMALLARSVGIPARVVGGYRVIEYNGVGDYHVVRKQNAHAWVEAWVPGKGWITYDPTPAAGMMEALDTQTPFVSALGDLLRSKWDDLLSWLDARSWTEVLTPLFALVLTFVGVRWWRARRERLERLRLAAEGGPLECFTELSDALERRGVARPPDETLERWAARLTAPVLEPEGGKVDLEENDASEAARLVREYAALRYGDIGDQAQLSAAMSALARRLG